MIWPGGRLNPTLHAAIFPDIWRNPQVGMQKGIGPPRPWKGNSMNHFSCLSIYSHSESLKMKAPSNWGPTVSAQDPYSPRMTLFGIHPLSVMASKYFKPISMGLGEVLWGVDSREPLSGWKTLCNMNQLITMHESSTWRADRQQLQGFSTGCRCLCITVGSQHKGSTVPLIGDWHTNSGVAFCH